MGSHDPRAFAMSVQESISLGGGRGALSAPEALCALREFALLGLLERDIRELSQGQLQLAALVRHLVQDPSVLLIDEGLSSVDIDLQIRATRYLSHWALQSQKAVLLVAHDLRLALRHATHVLIIHQGKKIWSGAKSDLSWRNALGLAYPHVDSGLLD
jgi:iron complex transport system ATP-binding protein